MIGIIIATILILDLEDELSLLLGTSIGILLSVGITTILIFIAILFARGMKGRERERENSVMLRNFTIHGNLVSFSKIYNQ